MPEAEKHIVTIGGGTGTFVVLSGLKNVPGVSLSAIVTTADDGGSTGHLRDAYGFLPVGDARQALVALAEEDTMLRELFAYRFEKGNVKGHTLGNLFLTALSDILGSESAAIAEASRILRVRGRVIPSTETPTVLVADLEDGTCVTGENAIGERPDGAGIRSVKLEKPTPISTPAREAINAADVIILGPGNLYASTVAALLPQGMQEAIGASKARTLYVVNLFTKRGQTTGFSASDHVREVAKYAGRAPDEVIVHDGTFSEDVTSWYAKEGEAPVRDDLPQETNVHRAKIAAAHILKPIPGDPLRRSLMRHDPELLREAILPLIS